VEGCSKNLRVEREGAEVFEHDRWLLGMKLEKGELQKARIEP
jgi:hypothetical protein